MGEIQEASQKLIQQAELSDMVQTRQALSLIIERKTSPCEERKKTTMVEAYTRFKE